jgi:hypothetical protein
MSIEYDHDRGPHTLESPRAALPLIFAQTKPASLLDVGCGTGTWLKVALELGVKTARGVDGIRVPDGQMQVPRELCSVQDLTAPLDLGRKFDVALCLEVGEHLEARHGPTLVQSLTDHADCVVFSAACPGQPGQHHVNCQWPAYWQGLFNAAQFACDDSIRWLLWNVSALQPWYRQNVFLARRDAAGAGREKRIDAVIHPEMAPLLNGEACAQFERSIARGALPARWYLRAPFTALAAKVRQRFSSSPHPPVVTGPGRPG